ncbi:hypothetical protein BH10BAC2_BH10BAC2_18750 [soil metagenome]
MPENPCDKNEISNAGKWLAGILLIIFTVLPIWLIMAYWPDRIPDVKEKIKPLYIDELYHIRLACIPDAVCCADTIVIRNRTIDSVQKTVIDTTVRIAADSANLAVDSGKSDQKIILKQRYYTKEDLIDLNTLLLILIAAAGFLGNMIHIATSLTTFIGNEQFKRSWILWYIVKPFTGAALALGLYFVFRGGFLNYSADAGSINLYGILTISLLAGLFTDKATLKLGEIFEVIFSVKSGDKRTDKLSSIAVKIASVTPDKLQAAPEENTITIKGENFDKAKLSFTINEEIITADKITITPATITINYTISATQATKTEFTLKVTDEKNTELCTKKFTV